MQETPIYVYVEDLQDSGAAATGWSVLSEGTVWFSHVPLTTCSRRAAMELATKASPPRGSQWRQHLLASEDLMIARSCRDVVLPHFLSGSCE